MMQGMGAGASTGKMVLYQRAKMGRKVMDWDVTERELNTNVSSHSCVGLITDLYGNYWLCEIDDSATVKLTLLFVFYDFLPGLHNTALGTPERLFIEGFALGYAQKTSTVLEFGITDAPVLVEDPYYTWKPMAYSWKFRWDGRQAKMIVHRGTGSVPTFTSVLTDIQTEEWTLDFTITKTDDGWDAAAAFSRSDQWTWMMTPDVASDVFYIPGNIFKSIIQNRYVQTAPSGRVHFYDWPVEIPLYGYYVVPGESGYVNDTWQSVKYSRSRETVEAIYSPSESVFARDFVACGKSAMAGGGTQQAGTRQTITFQFGETVLQSINDLNTVEKIVSFSHSETGTHHRSISGSSLSLTNSSGSPGSCSPVSFSLSPSQPGDYLVLADETRVDWYWSVDKTTTTYHPGQSRGTLVIPNYSAEGMLFTKRTNSSGSVNRVMYHDNAATYAPFYKEYTNFRSHPSGAPPDVNGTASDPCVTTIATGDSVFTLDTTTEQYGVSLACFAFGRTGRAVYSEDVEINQDTPITSSVILEQAPESGTYSNTEVGADVLMPCSLFEAFGGELMLRGYEPHFSNDFPPGFGDITIPPLLVGSI
jgi:hypothetical protein